MTHRVIGPTNPPDRAFGGMTTAAKRPVVGATGL
jgi:hypothetical protein